MARGLRIDLGKLGERLPEGLQRVGRRTAKAAETPLHAADAITFPEQLLEIVADEAAHPIVAGRLRRCTIQTRAHVLGIADLPAIDYEHAGALSVVLLRLRVERPEGDREACVRQHLPREIRRLAPGSSLRALAHEDEPRIAVIDWKTTAERLGQKLTWPATADQYAWPDADEWPAVDAIEVRDTRRHRSRLDRQRAEWRPVVARLVAASGRGTRVDSREQWKVELEVDGRRVTVKERVPDLALAKLVGFKSGEQRFGGLVTEVETVVLEGAPIAVLVAPGGDVAVDWEATLNQPEMRETGPA